jgi:hypothetical protein
MDSEVSDSDTEVVSPVADEEVKSFNDLVENALNYFITSFLFSLEFSFVVKNY